jgi:hypothetical protein
MPTRERSERMIRPAIHLFLYDIQENLDLRQSTMESSRSNGRAVRTMASRYFDLHYMVCALATNVEDEHQLLWRTLVTLVRHSQFPAELLNGELPQPLSGRLQHDDDSQRPANLWSALGIPPHPAFYYIITVPVDMDAVGEVPLVLSRTVRYTSTHEKENRSEIYHQIGGEVRNLQGTALPGVKVTLDGSTIEYITDSKGQFVLRGVPSGPIQLHVVQGNGKSQVVVLNVPAGVPNETGENSRSTTPPTSTYTIIVPAEPSTH